MQRKVELDDQRLSNVLGTTLLSRPTPLGLVLSGGGAKGIAYAGLVRTLELKKSLNDLRSVAGS